MELRDAWTIVQAFKAGMSKHKIYVELSMEAMMHMPAIPGTEYLKRIDRLQANVWIDGAMLSGNISEHPAFRGVLKNQAKLYDLQLADSKIDLMTFVSPSSGERVGTSYLEPKTKQDLEKRRLMIQEWAKMSGGMLGRSPDYMNTALMALHASADILSIQDKKFTRNLRSFFETAREHDYSLTHTFINPQVNRSNRYFENSDKIIAAQPIKKTADGLVMKGARLLATQGGITDELLVLPSSASAYNDDFAYGFSIPSNTPGLKFICRESFVYNQSAFDHPLAANFEEMDAVVVFDNVAVPWERIFFFNNREIAHKIYSESSFFPLVTHQVLARRMIKTEFILGIAQLLTETINISEYHHIQHKISEIIVGLETLKALLLSSELSAKTDQWGTMCPDENPLKTAVNLYPRLYPRFMEIIQLLGASGLISIPTERDFASEIKPDLASYLQAASANGEERVKIFRLAWDVCMSAFGTRQTLYERFFFGDPERLSSGLFQSYDKQPCKKFAEDFLLKNSSLKNESNPSI